MNDNSYTFQERVDQLALLYLEKHFDISKMTVAEYIKMFNAVSDEIITVLQHQ